MKARHSVSSTSNECVELLCVCAFNIDIVTCRWWEHSTLKCN